MNTENKLQPEETALQALIAKYRSDSAFKAAFDAAGSTEEAVRIAAQQGITVTLGEILALGSVIGDLSDAHLDQVSGGGREQQHIFEPGSFAR